MTEKEAREIYCQGEEAVVAKFMEFDARLKRLEEMIGMNSSNSSKPPSTDNKLTKNREKKAFKTRKKRGGQVGHKGKTLKISEEPDVVNVLTANYCECCHNFLDETKAVKIEKRQVFDLPDIKINITEFQSHTKVCPKCKKVNKPSFPEGINAQIQYGDNLKSFVSYCNTYQMMPYERISELIEDLTSHKISTGVIYNFLNKHYNVLEDFENDVKEKLLKEDVIHSDETGINIKAKLHWIHVASSKKLTYYMLHQKRGAKAMDEMGILPNYQGIAVHDHWKPYNRYECEHSFCNAHILRELNGVTQRNDVKWSENMHSLLLKMKKAVHKAKNRDKNHLTMDQIAKFTKNYKKIIKAAKNYYPITNKNNQKARGRPKQEKGKNLLDRLLKYQNETLRFLNDFRVPFTNNLAERDLRMIKVKEKISGSFASFFGGEMFCRIRSYISTLKKNNISVLKGLRDALNGKAYISLEVGC
jgi:transposase